MYNTTYTSQQWRRQGGGEQGERSPKPGKFAKDGE